MVGAVRVITAKDIPENGTNNSQFIPGYDVEQVSSVAISLY